MSGAMDALIVTCDQVPMPPLNGTSKKVHDVLAGLRNAVKVHALVYPDAAGDMSALREYWAGSSIEFHALERVWYAPRTRSVLSGRSVPTVTRNFRAESAVVSGLARRYANARLLIDFITGAPLVERFSAGVVISGHDCMSHLFREEGDRASSIATRAHFRLREVHARRAERRFYHQADNVHVVSEKDAWELRRIDPRIRTTVIPVSAQVPKVLKPCGAQGRGRRLIWGNLASPVILAGTRRLVAAAARRAPGALRGWTLVGRVEPEEAARLVPDLIETGVDYVPSIEDMSSVLAEASIVLLPDVGGTGQKNRTLDALAHGACVIGLAEVFRGIEPLGQYVEVYDFDEALTFAATQAAATIEAIGVRARAHAATFDVSQRPEQWLKLLTSLPPIRAHASGRNAR
jgi:hypothetical protein